MTVRVLCLLATGFEEIETVAPVDLLRRAGAEVVLASMSEHREVTGRCGMTLKADALLEAVDATVFDLLILPGGPGVAALRQDGRAALLALGFVARGGAVAAICAAPTVLHDAGVLEGRAFTAHFSTHGELPAARGEMRVVEDGPVITSRGAGTAIEFGLHLVRRFFGEAAVTALADAIMA